ncbi:MAG TPA: AAA family ATPase [Anaerolineales bacterium]|jgi:WD40 repeat protein
MNTKTNPYVGPRSFETGEKLYGRDRELRSLMALLIAERIVLMHSPSGAGKTSLLKAGLLPRLREEEFNVLPLVRVSLEPSKEIGSANRYLMSTLLSLEEGFPEAERMPVSELAGLSLDEYLTKRGPEKDTLLVLDQFEEVLTTASADREGKQEFFNQLGDALRNKTRWALFAMREDYLGMLAPYVRPIPDRLVTRFRLDLLGVDAAIQAMQMPAKEAGVNFTTDAAQKLADDLRRIQVQLPDGSLETQLGDYVEPVQLQVVCYRLWESLPADETEVDVDDLTKVGDVNQSLADYYAQSVKKVKDASGTPERTIREWFDRKLITPDGLRGQVRIGADQSEGLPNEDVRQLENAHLIRADQRAGQTWVELAHDRLVEPIRSSNHKWFLDNLSLFQRQAEVWLEQGRSEGLLLRGTDLEQAEKEAAATKLTPDEEAYLNACRLLRRRARREQILRRGITAGLVASIIMGIVAAYFGVSATRANQGLANAASTAEAASTQAFLQQSYAQVASTRAIDQQLTAQAASTQAIAQQSLAQAASTQAISNAYAAATAQAQSEVEKAKALEQEVIAQEQKKQAQASAMVAQSLLVQIKARDDLANLLAVAAFQISDTTRTRMQMLATVYSRGRLPLTQNNSSGITPFIAYLPDSQKLVSTNYFQCDQNNYYMCDGGVIKLWDIQRDTRPGTNVPTSLRQQTASISPPGMLDTAALSPDGTTLATASCNPIPNRQQKCSQENILLWNPLTREKTGQPLSFVGESANDKNVRLAFSPDGKTLALALNIPTNVNSSAANPPTLILWDLVTFTQKGQVTPPNGLAAMAFSPDGKTLALASGRGIVLMDSSSLKTTEPDTTGITKPVLSLAYSPDGNYLAVGTDDGTITLLETRFFRPQNQPFTNQSKVLSMAFSPDGKILAAGYQDAGLILWDVAGRQRLISQIIYQHVLTPDIFPIYSLAFSPDGKQLASTSNEIILWDMDPASWVTKACTIAGRNFTRAEWQQYFPDEDYQKTCAQFPEGR